MNHIKLALDWTPNANHIGFFVARKKGFYRDSGLEVDLMDPSADNYATTPAKRVEVGEADLALCPTESLISYRTKSDPIPLVGIATLHRRDLSAIAALEDSGIASPRDLDGKVYASYKARYEDAIVGEMIRNDGGRGDLEIVYPDKLGIWERVVDGEADATWIFLNWEGVMADASGRGFRYFRLADFGVPYGYSPVIADHAERLDANPEMYRGFLEATRRGHLYSQDHPTEAADILREHLPLHEREIDLEKALARTLPHIGTARTWGTFEQKPLQDFLTWIYEKGLEKRRFATGDIITGKYLN